MFSELEQPAIEESLEGLKEVEEQVEAALEELAEIIETKNEIELNEHENEMQSKLSLTTNMAYLSSEIADIENRLSQIQFDNPHRYQSIEMTQFNHILQQHSFGLSFIESPQHDFSINQLYTEISALEKILKDVESPRLLEQFQTQVEEEAKRLLDIETHQTSPDLVDSLELVSQGPTLPEPPPYDFREELEELEGNQDNTATGHLLQTFRKAQRTQMAASLNLVDHELPIDRVQSASNNQETIEKTKQKNSQQQEISKENGSQNQNPTGIDESTQVEDEPTSDYNTWLKHLQRSDEGGKTHKVQKNSLSPKFIEKEWNKYVLRGKPVPEELQKIVFQLYESGFLKDAGLIQKKGKWFLETSWENYNPVKSFLDSPGIQKSLAFQLWAEFKTKKPLHYVQGKLNKNAMYYSIELKHSINLPQELNGKTVCVRNTKSFFKGGHPTEHYLRTTTKSFETIFLKKIANWGIHQEEYKLIRDKIFQQFSEKYGDLFEKIMIMQKRPMIFMQLYHLNSLEKSFVKCFAEYFNKGSRLWKFKNRSGRKAFNSYYRYFKFQPFSVLTRLIDNEMKRSINLNSPYIKLGTKCAKTKDPKDYQIFVEKWNQHVDEGKKITQDMWVSYNKIQTLANYPLRRFRYLHMEQFRMGYYHDLTKNFENLVERRGRFPTSLYEHWFVHRGLNEGKSPFIEINIHNPFTKLNERYFIPNANYGWNPNPAYTRSVIGINNKDRTGPRMIIDVLMKEIPIKTHQTRRLRELIVDKLRVTGFIGNEKAGNWFKNLYRLKYEKTAIDEVLNLNFWKAYNSNRLWKDRGYLSRSKYIHRLINHYKQNEIQLKEFTKDLVELTQVDSFKIALVDKSTVLEAVWKDLEKEINNDNSNYWNAIKTHVSARKLANIIQRQKIRHLKYLDVDYTIKQARLEYNPDITGDPIKFWNECNSNGITRLSAALMQNRTIRSKIREITKNNSELGTLIINKKVSVEDHWGRDNTERNVVTSPDGVTYKITGEKKKGRAVEFFQNKIISELSGNPGNLPEKDYLLDFFKTIGTANSDTGVYKFQVEFVPKGETLGGLINTKSNENHCIISYWGKCRPRAQRIGDITSGFVTGRFKENITSKKQLVEYIVSKSYQGEIVLNGTEMEKIDKRAVKDLVSSLGSLKGLKPTTFYKNWFIEVMKRYSTDLEYSSQD